MTSDPWGHPARMDTAAFMLWLELANADELAQFGSFPVPDRFLSTSVLTGRINASMERVRRLMER